MGRVVERRLAIVSSDGKVVDNHFGRASRFAIYAERGKGWQFLETRETEPACRHQAHADNGLESSADIIADCRWVVVSQIGPAAIDVLLARNILPIVLEGPVPEALAVISSRYRHTFKSQP